MVFMRESGGPLKGAMHWPKKEKASTCWALLQGRDVHGTSSIFPASVHNDPNNMQKAQVKLQPALTLMTRTRPGLTSRRWIEREGCGFVGESEVSLAWSLILT